VFRPKPPPPPPPHVDVEEREIVVKQLDVRDCERCEQNEQALKHQLTIDDAILAACNMTEVMNTSLSLSADEEEIQSVIPGCTQPIQHDTIITTNYSQSVISSIKNSEFVITTSNSNTNSTTDNTNRKSRASAALQHIRVVSYNMFVRLPDVFALI
jgi:hypothetical protein